MSKKIDYGGAFDIDPYSFWVRSDIDEFLQELSMDSDIENNHINLINGYIDDNVFEIDFSYQDIQDTVSQKIDMRKIKAPNDLNKKYIPLMKNLILEKCDLTP